MFVVGANTLPASMALFPILQGVAFGGIIMGATKTVGAGSIPHITHGVELGTYVECDFHDYPRCFSTHAVISRLRCVRQ